MVSVTITASNVTTEQFVQAFNLANPKKEQVVAKPAITYERGQLLQVPNHPKGILSNAEFVQLIKQVPSTNIFHVQWTGRAYAGLLNSTDASIAQSLTNMGPGDTLDYCMDVVEAGYRIKFGWTKLEQGWVCSYTRAVCILLVDVT